jgi:hypothetical protein
MPLAHPNIGCIYLEKNDNTGCVNPPTCSNVRNMTNSPGWTNTHTQGVLVRTIWQVVEPSEGVYYWDFIDAGAAAAASSGKCWGLLIDAGEGTPQWVYDAGATKWLFQTGYDQSHNPTYNYQPLPWETIYQTKWNAFVAAVGARYDGDTNLKWVILEGFGRQAESFFVSLMIGATPGIGDALEADQLAHAYDSSYVGHNDPPLWTSAGLDGWYAGAQVIAAAHASAWPNHFFNIVSGAPYPNDDGSLYLSNYVNFCAATYPGHFGYESDGLTSMTPTTGYAYTTITALHSSTRCGWQFNAPQQDPDKISKFTAALGIGVASGANYIEVFSGNAGDPDLANAIDDANRAMGIGGFAGKLPGVSRRMWLSRR